MNEGGGDIKTEAFLDLHISLAFKIYYYEIFTSWTIEGTEQDLATPTMTCQGLGGQMIYLMGS